MKKETFTRKDGTEGTKYKLEPNDQFIPRFDTPRKSEVGKYENWSIGITTVPEGDEIFVQLTKTQAEKLQELGNVQGKKLECYAYTAHEKECVGIRQAA